QGIFLHEPAIGARTDLSWPGKERLARHFLSQSMQHPRLGNNDEGICRRIAAVADHLFGRTDFVGQKPNGVSTFWMYHHRCRWMKLPNGVNTIVGELNVNVASTAPQFHRSTRSLHYPAAEILVGNEQNIAVTWDALNDFDCVTARANHVGKRFNSSAAVYI